MGRQLRIEYPGAFYHVMAHGNGMQWIYKSGKDIQIFKESLKAMVEKYNIHIHAAVLMRNHYHLLIDTPDGNLVAAIKKLNRDVSRGLNRKNKRTGSVFKERYKSILVEKESYYLIALRYISQNPLRQKIVKRCEEYEGSYLKWYKWYNKRRISIGAYYIQMI